MLLIVMAITTTTITAQELNSAYFIQDYKYRHVLNPAFDNEQSYISIPMLGNLNVKMQGNFGIGDMLFENPQTGNYDRTFMHPEISYDDAMAGFNEKNRIAADIGLTLLSIGFKAFGGYNTIEAREKTSINLQLPYQLFDFAKNTENKNYQFNKIGMNAMAFAELALGHSRQINKDLRVGAKMKFLFGIGRADLVIEDMQAKLDDDQWLVSTGKAHGEINMKGIVIPNKTDEYENGTQYQHADLGNIDINGGGIGGVGIGFDIGAEYRIMEGLKISAAVIDLGFIKWNQDILLTQLSNTFAFDGFHDIAVREASAPEGATIGEQFDEYSDQLSDFISLRNMGDQGSKNTSLAATANLGIEYQLPMYQQLTFGLLAQHHFNGDYAWSEGRISANWNPLKWLNGGMNLAFNSYCTSVGWIINIHPKSFNFFIGMDHILAKTTKQFIPLSSNGNIATGINITF